MLGDFGERKLDDNVGCWKNWRSRQADRKVMSGIYIAVGSNIDPEVNVERALRLLGRFLVVKRLSTFFRTAPLDRPEQPAFCNGVIEIDTLLAPRDLKYTALRAIEAELGRVRSQDKHAPRPIDLDIAVFRNRVVDEPGLTIPDPDIVRRPFIAVPLYELDPKMLLPGLELSLATIVAALKAHTMEPLEAFTERLRRIGPASSPPTGPARP